MSCIFCEIAAGRRHAALVYEDERALAFRDIHPQAPVHVLVIPRAHISGPLEVDADNAPMIGHLIAVAAQVARQQGFAESGYRLVINEGRDGGQSVFHLHVHLLAGRRLTWPPG